MNGCVLGLVRGNEGKTLLKLLCFKGGPWGSKDTEVGTESDRGSGQSVDAKNQEAGLRLSAVVMG